MEIIDDENHLHVANRKKKVLKMDEKKSGDDDDNHDGDYR